MTTADTSIAPTSEVRDERELAALAKGGRTNLFGFVMRLGARIPFLLVAGRLYGAETLGRFALAVLVVEFAAQLATLGLKRGLAEQLSAEGRPDEHVVFDALLVATIASAITGGALMLFPAAMFPNSQINGLDRLLPLIILAIAVADVALAACAFRFDIAATVRARSLVEPWAISLAAPLLYLYSARDGLILSYVIAMLAAFVTAMAALFRHYPIPRDWRPQPVLLWRMTRRNLPLAAADAIEWGTRRLDLWLLGFFVSPAAAGIYYVAQQFASIPQKLKTSFEPILGPIIARNVAAKHHAAISHHVSQVGFWIVAAQVGIGLALAIPGEAAMGVVGPQFVSGTAALALLLAAEVTASPAVVSEAALVYLARVRNLWLSIATIGLQAVLSLAFIIVARRMALPEMYVAAMPALALVIALGFGSVLKGRLLGRIVGERIRAYRPSLLLAAGAAGGVGYAFTALPRQFEWAELTIGLPAILFAYALVIWRVGFGEDDRKLFRKGAMPSAPD